MAVLHRLLESADVFLTNMRPRRLGAGRARRRAAHGAAIPRLVYARGHGYGARGPTPTRPATTPRRSGPAAAWPTS